MDLMQEAILMGFSGAAVMDTKELVFVPEYRTFCEENLCGCYNLNPACPPASGTVEEMKQRALSYEKTLVLQTTQEDLHDPAEYKKEKLLHNKMTEELAEKMRAGGKDRYSDHECRTIQEKFLYVSILCRCTEDGRCGRNALLDR